MSEKQDEQNSTNSNRRKISFYLTPEQAHKLDRLVFTHLERTGVRINRNDIVRYLIEQCDMESLKGL